MPPLTMDLRGRASFLESFLFGLGSYGISGNPERDDRLIAADRSVSVLSAHNQIAGPPPRPRNTLAPFNSNSARADGFCFSDRRITQYFAGGVCNPAAKM